MIRGRLAAPSGRRLAEIFLFVATLLWGSTFVVMKNASMSIAPVDFVFYRYLLATILCAILFRRRLARIRWRSVRRGIFLGAFLFLGTLFQVWGLETTSASNSAFLTGFTVITVPLLESALARRRPPSGIIAGAALALVGIALLSGLLGEHGGHGLRLGDGLTLLGTLCWTVHITSLDRFVDGEDAYALTFMQFLVATLASGTVSAVTGRVFAMPYLEGVPWFAVLYLGIVGTFIAFTIQTVFQFRTTPSRAVLIFTFEPVFALLFALLIPGPDGRPEILTPIRITGCLLVFTGILASEFLPLRPKISE